MFSDTGAGRVRLVRVPWGGLLVAVEHCALHHRRHTRHADRRRSTVRPVRSAFSVEYVFVIVVAPDS